MRMRNPLAALVAALLLCGSVAPAALAQSSPFSAPQPLVPPEQATPAPVNTTDPDSEGLKGWQETLIFIGGVALLAGIGIGVVMDARRRSPVTEADLHPGRAAATGDPEHRRAMDRKRKSKQRTQRSSRKKNRPKRK